MLPIRNLKIGRVCSLIGHSNSITQRGNDGWGGGPCAVVPGGAASPAPPCALGPLAPATSINCDVTVTEYSQDFE